jgi:tetratricopeptide (TPR) repeat protein
MNQLYKNSQLRKHCFHFATLLNLFFFCLILFLNQCSYGQHFPVLSSSATIKIIPLNLKTRVLPDSIFNKYNMTAEESAKGKLLIDYIKCLPPEEQENIIIRALFYFEKQNDQTGVNYCELALATVEERIGNDTAALQKLLPLLEYFKKNKDLYGMSLTLNRLGTLYDDSKNYPLGIYYFKKAIPICTESKDSSFLILTLCNIAILYSSLKNADSTLYYALSGMSLAEKTKRHFDLIYAFEAMGRCQIILGNPGIAQAYLRQAEETALKNHQNKFLPYIYNDLAALFFIKEVYDSTILYSHKAVSYGKSVGYLSEIMNGFEKLYQCYDIKNIIDSSNKYYRMHHALKDSLLNLDQIRRSEIMHVMAERHQQDMEIQTQKEFEKRSTLTAAGFFLLVYIAIILLLVLSCKKNIFITRKLIAFVVMIFFLFTVYGRLIIHELLALFIQSPIFMFIALVAIAILYIPVKRKIKQCINKMKEKKKESQKTEEKLKAEPHEEIKKNNNVDDDLIN